MKYLRAFIAGMVLPAAVLPVAYGLLSLEGHTALRNRTFQFLPLFLPMVWGMWNMLYVAVGTRCPLRDRHTRLWVSGATLGIILACIGVFVIRIPELLMGFTGLLKYVPLLTVPLFYGIVWRYVISYLNDKLRLDDR